MRDGSARAASIDGLRWCGFRQLRCRFGAPNALPHGRNEPQNRAPCELVGMGIRRYAPQCQEQAMALGEPWGGMDKEFVRRGVRRECEGVLG